MNERYLKFCTALALAALLSGCATYDPYTGRTAIDPGATAALIGGLAVAGALAYAVRDRDGHHRHGHRAGRRHHDDHGYRHRRYYRPPSPPLPRLPVPHFRRPGSDCCGPYASHRHYRRPGGHHPRWH